MQGVFTTPMPIRCEGKHTEEASHPIIETSAAKIGAMATIMLNHENSDQEACGRDCKYQRQEVVDVYHAQHNYPERYEWNYGNREFRDRT